MRFPEESNNDVTCESANYFEHVHNSSFEIPHFGLHVTSSNGGNGNFPLSEESRGSKVPINVVRAKAAPRESQDGTDKKYRSVRRRKSTRRPHRAGTLFAIELKTRRYSIYITSFSGNNLVVYPIANI